MFFFEECEDYGKLIVFDTDDRSFEVIKMDDFCSYLYKSGRCISDRFGYYKLVHDGILGDITLKLSDDGLRFYSYSNVANFMSINIDGTVIRILDRIYHYNPNGRGIALGKMVSGSGRVRLFLEYAYTMHPILITRTGVSIPELEDLGVLSSNHIEISNSLYNSDGREFFIPFASAEVKRRLLLNM